jgi:hypothetical protein
MLPVFQFGPVLFVLLELGLEVETVSRDDPFSEE